MRPVNEAVLLSLAQGAALRTPYKGSCNTAAIPGRTVDHTHLGAQEKGCWELEMYAASTIHGPAEPLP